MKRELVSVIVPVYNTPEEKLEDCLQSLLDQTYEDIEILLVDDGSRRETAMLLDRAAKRDLRFRVIHQLNQGVSAARNTGMDAAEGEYLVFVDADDCVNSTWLAEAVRLAQRYDADVVYAKVMMCQSAPGQHRDAASCGHAVFEEEELWKVQEALLRNESDLLEGMTNLDLGPCAKLFRRRCVGTVRFPVGVKLSEDQAFNHQALRCSRTCVLADIDAYYYVENMQSVSHTCHPDAVDVVLRAMALVRAELMDRPEIEQAYCFRVLDDLFNAIQFAWFSGGKNRKRFAQRMQGIREAKRRPQVREAMRGINLGGRYRLGWKIKLLLLRYCPAAFVGLKMVRERLHGEPSVRFSCVSSGRR